jgi:hypothetical protein
MAWQLSFQSYTSLAGWSRGFSVGPVLKSHSKSWPPDLGSRTPLGQIPQERGRKGQRTHKNDELPKSLKKQELFAVVVRNCTTAFARIDEGGAVPQR